MTKRSRRPVAGAPSEPDTLRAAEPLQPDEEGTPAFAGPEDAARYLASMSGELAAIARGARLDVLAYLLEMARAEALSRSQ